ncbi:2-oxo acid dehydrogenase subunit E2 [Candidatus Bathyarchaeota archaeon]|nr:2-oxo acid dehydrogenase subunit E2 [Candidatus Bathyarchaeota archaeon]
MVTKVVMPRLSLTMKEGTVGTWYKKEGDNIEKGESLVEVFSEKATYDLEAPASGVLRKIMVQEGADAPVNAVLAVITAQDEAFSEAEVSVETPKMVEGIEKRVLASPAAKRLAREQGIDLSLVKGSEPEGRIVEEDVRRFIKESRGILPRIKEVIPLSGYRKTSAERVSTSFRTAPHSTVVMEVDASKIMVMHDKLQVSYTAIAVKAAATSLVKCSMINSTLERNQIKIFKDVNIGVAVATRNGLVVPVIHNADKKTLKETDALIEELGEKADQGKLAKGDLTGGTFTVTNLGMYGVDFFMPIINPPEAAILAIGRTVEKPVVTDGKIETKPLMILSLAYDHRIVDGASAAQFLHKVKTSLENLEFHEN